MSDQQILPGIPGKPASVPEEWPILNTQCYWLMSSGNCDHPDGDGKCEKAGCPVRIEGGQSP